MCARYLTWEEICSFEILPYSHSGHAVREIRPDDFAPVFVMDGGTIAARAMRWGFAMQRGNVIFHARAETVKEKPLTKNAFLSGRCAVPVYGFYSWNAQGEGYLCREKNGNLIYMAGLWKRIGDEERFLILTAKPPQEGPGGGRMPLLLYADRTIRWLEDGEQAGRICESASSVLLSCAPMKIRA